MVDVSRTHTLGALASSVTDSLVHALRRRANTHVLSGSRLGELERQFGSDQVLGMSLGATAVFRGSLAERRDSLLLFVAVFDTREQRYVRSFRAVAPRSAPEDLSRKMLPMLQEWLTRPGRSRGE